LKCPPPVYPDIALRLKREGIVELRLRVDETGRVVEVQVLRGVQLLTEAAVRAARARSYKPATRGGAPEASVVDVPIAFRLPR
jgi:TonB family protein